MNKSKRIGLVMGLAGIVLVLVYLAINQLSADGPYAVRQMLDNALVQTVSIIIGFMGGEAAVAVATVLTARAKGQTGIGVAAALFGLFMVLLIFALRPGLIPSYCMAFIGPVAFLGFLAWPDRAPPVIRGAGGPGFADHG